MRPRAYPHVSQRPGRRTIKVRKHEMDPRKLGHAVRIGGCSPSISAWGPTCFRGVRNYERNPLDSPCATPLRPPSVLINRGCASSTDRHAPSDSARPTTSDFGGAPSRVFLPIAISPSSPASSCYAILARVMLQASSPSHDTTEETPESLATRSLGLKDFALASPPAWAPRAAPVSARQRLRLRAIWQVCWSGVRRRVAKVPAPQGMCPLYLAFAASSPRGTASWPLCTGHPSRLVGMGTPSNASWHG